MPCPMEWFQCLGHGNSFPLPDSGIFMDGKSHGKALEKQEAPFNLGLHILNVLCFPRGGTKFPFWEDRKCKSSQNKEQKPENRLGC